MTEDEARFQVRRALSLWPSRARTVSATADSEPRARTVWDEEFRFRLFEVDGSPRQHLVVKVKRRERDGEDDVDLVGEARIMVDGSWDHFDRASPRPPRSTPGRQG